MKKLFTLACASVVAAGAMAAAPQHIDYSGLTKTLKPEAKLLLQQEMINLEKGLPMDEGKRMAKKAYEDKDGSVWTANFMNNGAVVDLYEFTNQNGQVVEVTFEELPYYLVILLIQKYGAADGSSTATSSFLAQWNLWWPSTYFHNQFVDAWAENDESVLDNPDWSIASFDNMCNLHENELYDEFTYCSLFKEAGGGLPVGEFDTYEQDGKYYYSSPTALSWGMEFGGARINNAYTEDSGANNGLFSTFEFNSYDPISTWTEFDGRMFYNGIARYSVNFSSDARIEGWSKQFLAYPEIGEIHIFNRGIGSRALSGDTDIYGTNWGPLQMYEIWGVGKEISLIINPAAENGPYDDSAISIDFRDDYDPTKVSFTDAHNYFRAALFCAEGDELANGGKWHMLEPKQVPGTTSFVVTPVANCLVPRRVFTTNNDDYLVVVNKSFQDLPIFENTFMNLGTIDGFVLNYNNGFNEYTGYFKGDVVFHYDATDMSKTKLIPSVGELTPDPVLVNEIEASNEAPVYYNLQGVRVANPEKGLFIQVKGNNTSKVIL